MSTPANQYPLHGWRFWFVGGVLMLGFALLISRAAYLQVLKTEFLQKESAMRAVQDAPIAGFRGAIRDREGKELAVSLGVVSVALDPKQILDADNKDGLRSAKAWYQLAALLGLQTRALNKLVDDNAGKRFIWAKRQLDTSVAMLIKRLDLPGVQLQNEFRRYYPTGEVSSHVVGLTNIDDTGIAGVERSYNDLLVGKTGKERLVRDRRGRVVENQGVLEAAISGADVQLALDSRLQAIAYQELKNAVQLNRAHGGSAVILDVHTGEVLAMVNEPTFNPNKRRNASIAAMRNRAVTDTFEPGSTAKPITAVAALESGKFTPKTLIDTNPGYITVGGFPVRDHKNEGVLDVTGVIQKSSNIGSTYMALAVGKEKMFDVFQRFGFGQPMHSGFPGESAGRFDTQRRWSKFELATLSFGYALTTTPLQLAHAYTILASGGINRPVRFLKSEGEVIGERVLDEKIADAVVMMMEQVVTDGGTARKARVAGYRISGKTGTARKAIKGGYAKDLHSSVFAGMAPAADPRLVMVVMIDEPNGTLQNGGDVAAPVFSAVMNQALRLINAAPDDEKAVHFAQVGGGTHDS